mmetsp:Transcript_27472/g.66670  ORF Transcript_27472/g.66670 Transcript_27472/m.66670 type:complete len:229 (-) Transcript_27472:118-804(-)
MCARYLMMIGISMSSHALHSSAYGPSASHRRSASASICCCVWFFLSMSSISSTTNLHAVQPMAAGLTACAAAAALHRPSLAHTSSAGVWSSASMMRGSCCATRSWHTAATVAPSASHTLLSSAATAACAASACSRRYDSAPATTAWHTSHGTSLGSDTSGAAAAVAWHRCTLAHTSAGGAVLSASTIAGSSLSTSSSHSGANEPRCAHTFFFTRSSSSMSVASGFAFT